MVQTGQIEALKGSSPPVLVRAFSRDYRPGEKVDPHAHEADQLLYASTGVMTLTADSGLWVIPAHRGVWIPAGVRHSIRMTGAVHMRTLYLRAGRGDIGDRCRVLAVSPLLRELILEVVRRASARYRRENYRLLRVLLDHLRVLPTAPLHLPEPEDARARFVTDAIWADPADRRTLREFARPAGASARTLARLFVSQTSMTFGIWRQQARILAALQRLAAGESVTSAALNVGYESPSSFVAMFKRSLGQSPGRYFASGQEE